MATTTKLKPFAKKKKNTKQAETLVHVWTSHAAPLPLARKAPRMEKRWGAAEARPRPRPRGRVVGFSAIHGALVSFSALHSRACCFLVASACPLLPHPRRASVDGAPGAGGVWCRDAMRPSLRSDPILPGGEGQSPSPQPPLSWPRSTASSAGIARLFLVCGSRVSCPCTRPGPGLFLDPSHPCSPWPAGPSHSPSSRNRGGAPTTDRRRVFFFPQTLYSSLLAYGALGCSPSLASVSTANQTGHLVHYRAHSFICCFHAITSLFFFLLSI